MSGRALRFLFLACFLVFCMKQLANNITSCETSLRGAGFSLLLLGVRFMLLTFATKVKTENICKLKLASSIAAIICPLPFILYPLPISTSMFLSNTNNLSFKLSFASSSPCTIMTFSGPLRIRLIKFTKLD